jgi:hypothetical protein
VAASAERVAGRGGLPTAPSSASWRSGIPMSRSFSRTSVAAETGPIPWTSPPARERLHRSLGKRSGRRHARSLSRGGGSGPDVVEGATCDGYRWAAALHRSES